MEGKKSYRIAKRPLYREEIKEALMEAIVSGELAPGERIVETRWAKELGVSQSPIREAIRELEMIGLVENIPYKGCIVRKLTRKDIEDTYKVRIALETMAICEAIQGDVQALLPGLQQHLQAMIQGAEGGNIQQFIEHDACVHEGFVEASDNELLKRLWRQCSIRDNTKLSTIFSKESIVELAKRHELIYQAIAERDMVRARAEIEEHFDMLIAGLEKLDA